jgi:hypothetical protein
VRGKNSARRQHDPDAGNRHLYPAVVRSRRWRHNAAPDRRLAARRLRDLRVRDSLQGRR